MAVEATTSYTSSEYVNGILWGYGGGVSSTLASKWSTASLTYSFSGSWSAAEQAAATNALGYFSSVSNLTFSAGGGASDLTFNKYHVNDGSLGYAYPPDSYWGTSNTGQINYNTYYSQYWNTSDLQVGGVMFTTVVHELGHALGLGHPHDNAYLFPGVSSWSDTGDNGLNRNLHTVMSYNDVGSFYSPDGLESYGFQTLGAFDIAAIQHLYGASSRNNGDDVYEIPTSNAAGTFYEAIWDTGGTDTISYAGSDTVTIDLHAATLDAADGRLAGGGISKPTGIYGGFTIANGVVIENAIAGSGDDIVRGNA
ncbi:MAG: matrixin family metalloprotease, partial [Rhodospirillaceae bacterium]|nr:matrixin family metalloprotease [Rhodospirillaceae bacterium]